MIGVRAACTNCCSVAKTVTTSASATAIVIPADTMPFSKTKLVCSCFVRYSCIDSVSTFTLMIRAKKKTAANAKPKALATESSTSLLKGEAMAVSSMHRREKTKAIRSCRTRPGKMRAQKPTRKSLPSQRDAK